MTKSLESKVAWVTGAAGAIGAEVCRRFAREGAQLVISGRNATSLESLAGEIASAGGAAPLVIVLDVTQREPVDAAVSRIMERFGRIDILVNSTTNPIFADFQDLADEDWIAVLEAKFMAYMRTARAAIPHMVASGGGAVINVSGRGGHQPNSPSHLAGSCANGAVNTLTKGLANLYGPQGVRVNAVAPGPVVSERYRRIQAANRAVAAKRGTAERSGAVVTSPLGDMAQPEEIADVIFFLASDLSRYMTGCILQTDGGGTASL